MPCLRSVVSTEEICKQMHFFFDFHQYLSESPYIHIANKFNMKIKFFVILSAILLLSCSRESAVQFSHPFLEVENNNQSENWYDIPGMICRDGSPTGIGYRVGNPKKLAIYINGGGACFNPNQRVDRKSKII
jgi:hypothetical protein